MMFLPDIPPGNAFPHMLKDMAEGMSQGAVVINIIGGPEAIPAADAPAAVQRGTVDMADAFGTYCDTIAPGADCLGRAEYDPAGLRANGTYDYIQGIFAKAGLYLLGAASPSAPQKGLCINLKDEIKHIEDFKGLKIADAGAQYQPFLEALGAVCVPIPTPDNFTAMERGTVDGYVLGVPGIQDFGLTPVTGCMLDETFTSSGAWFIVNLEKWNSLPPDIQKIMAESAAVTEKELLEIFNTELDQGVYTRLKEWDVTIYQPPEDELKRWEAITRPLWDWWAGQNPASLELLQCAFKITGKK